MKHRLVGGLLVMAAALGACAPPDAGASGGPAAPTSHASDAVSEPAAPAPTEVDEY